ncbi:MAG: hypothetical protein PHI58_01935 [Candidatus Omnitrophica bacterium]|nr:hypothetical protein [Candidatus Omnitrophota bacterium]
MTICIGALCDQGKNCIVAADREITAPGLSLEFDHEKKIEPLTDSCVVMSAGDSLLAAEVIEKTRSIVTGKSGATIRQIAEALKNVYFQVHTERAENVILRPRGLTLAEYKQNGAQQIPLQAYMNIDNLFWTFGINVVEFIIAGVDSTGAHLFRIYYSGIAGGNWLEWCDRIGFRAIGSGALHSAILLSLDGQHKNTALEQTIYNIYSAKKSAEVAPGVGPSTDIAVITSSKVDFLSTTAIDKLSTVRCEALKNRLVNSEKIKGIYESR